MAMPKACFFALAVPLAHSATTVLVMRHCARSTGDKEVATTTELPFSYENNYSAQPWPAFDAGPMYCLSRGADIIEGEGKWMREHGNLPAPILATMDEMERDVETGQRFMKGLQATFDHKSFVVDNFYKQFQAQECEGAYFGDWTKIYESFATSLKEATAQSPELTQRLYEIMGVGAGGDWTNAGCAVNVSKFLPGFTPIVGACQAAASFGERLLMEWAGGMQTGWGRVMAEEEIPKLLHLHESWFRAVYGDKRLAAHMGSAMARNVLAELENGEAGTKIFVGHDSDLAALSRNLGLRWDASPWAVNATLPGSILRFDLDNATALVQATYNFVPSFKDSKGNMRSVAADFGLGSGNKAPLTSVKALVEQNTVPECAGLASRSLDRFSLQTFLV